MMFYHSDSGAGLVKTRNDKLQIIGIVISESTDGKCSGRDPMVFTDVRSKFK